MAIKLGILIAPVNIRRDVACGGIRSVLYLPNFQDDVHPLCRICLNSSLEKFLFFTATNKCGATTSSRISACRRTADTSRLNQKPTPTNDSPAATTAITRKKHDNNRLIHLYHRRQIDAGAFREVSSLVGKVSRV